MHVGLDRSCIVAHGALRNYRYTFMSMPTLDREVLNKTSRSDLEDLDAKCSRPCCDLPLIRYFLSRRGTRTQTNMHRLTSGSKIWKRFGLMLKMFRHHTQSSDLEDMAAFKDLWPIFQEWPL